MVSRIVWILYAVVLVAYLLGNALMPSPENGQIPVGERQQGLWR